MFLKESNIIAVNEIRNIELVRNFLLIFLIIGLNNIGFSQSTSHQNLIDQIKKTKNPVDFQFNYITYNNGNVKYEGWAYLVDAKIPDKPGWTRKFNFGIQKEYHRNGKIKIYQYVSINDTVNDTLKLFTKKGVCYLMYIYTAAENANYKASAKNLWTYPYVFEATQYHIGTGNIYNKVKQIENKMVGNYLEYYPNSQLKVTGKYNNSGKAIGDWTYFNKDGSIKKIEKNLTE